MKLPGLDAHAMQAQALAQKSAAPGDADKTRNARELRTAAESFESLLVNEMLKSMRSAAGLGDKAFGESVFTAMLDEKFAQNIAESGGFGLADSLVQQIRDPSAQDATSFVDSASEAFDVSTKFRKGGPS